MVTGVEKGKLQMEEYNPKWEKIGQETVELLKTIMVEAIDIKHVGSTAIRGMFAKPIIDIAVLVDSLDCVEGWVEPLTEIGFFYAGEVIEGGRDFGRDNPETGNRDIHVHIVPEGSTRWDGYVYIVEYCNEFPEERDAYAAVKQELLDKYADEPKKYGPAKREFVDALELRAFAWKKANAPILMRLKDLAADYPSRVAVCDMYGPREKFRQVSYGQLYDLAGRVAAKLKAKGFKRGTPVIVRMERRAEYIAAVYGILMARGIVIPAIPSYPDARINVMMEDSGAELVISDSFFEDINNYEPSPAVHIADDEIVWMNYTSGSTGKPKGVEYAYKSVDTGIALAGTELFNGMDELNHASTVSMSFAAAAFDVYSVLYLGGTLHLIPEDARKDPALISKYIYEHDVISVTISPSMIRFFKAPENLRRLLTIGQRVINAYSDKYETLAAYGTTECFTACLAFKVDKNYENTPVGKKIGLFEAAVVDEAGNSLPENQEGEIAIYGYTAEGYRGLEEATGKAFIDIGDGKHCHLTGDIGYMDENGVIVLLNRKDWMVKISGQRVDPAEPERAIRAVDGVGDCVVKAFYKESGDAFLCAYYTAEEEIPRDKLLSKVAEELPPYMMPTYVVKLDAIPLTVSGKYDHNKLEDPRKLITSINYEAPRTAFEARVCEAMAKVLGREKVGRSENFFEIGGDSVLVAGLIYELNEPALVADDIYKAKTPEEIAERYKKNREERIVCKLTPEILEEYKAKAHELYPLQYHYYKYKKMIPDAAIGNTAALFEWDKTKYTAKKLAEAIDEVIANFEVFSTEIIEDEEGRAYLKRGKSEPEKTQVVELSDEELEAMKGSLIQSFDIVNGPLFRVKVFSTESKLFMFMDMHHVISDAYTRNRFVRYIQDVLNGESLPEDYYYVALELMRKFIRFREIPEGYAIVPHYDMEPNSCTCDIVFAKSACTLKEIEDKLAKHGLSSLEFFTACVMKALAEYESNNKVSIEIMNANRNASLGQLILGMMVYAYPVDAEMREGEDFEAYLKRSSEILKGSLHVADRITMNRWSKPISDDILIVNYIPRVEAGERDWSPIELIDNNAYSMNSIQAIAMEGEPEEPLTFLFKYNNTAYKRSSVERYVQIFMELFGKI